METICKVWVQLSWETFWIECSLIIDGQIFFYQILPVKLQCTQNSTGKIFLQVNVLKWMKTINPPSTPPPKSNPLPNIKSTNIFDCSISDTEENLIKSEASSFT